MDKTIPIDALFDSSGVKLNPDCDPRPALQQAQLILGVDVTTGREFLVYGRKTLEKIIRTGKGRQVRTLKVSLDQETDELERLLALVTVVKGRHDYEESN
jgi:hypothetical protein